MVSEAVDLEKATVRHDENKPKHPGNGEQDEDGDEDEDDIASTTSTTVEYECDNNNSQALTLADVDNQDRSPCFQNIEVTNSSDVHFGNKTYYQGPVTIKQILYTNPNSNSLNSDNQNSEQDTHDKLPISDGNDNNGYVADGLGGNVILKNGHSNIANNRTCNTNSSANPNNWTGKSKGKKWLQNRTGKELVIGTAILICIVVSIIGVTVILITKYLQDQNLQNTTPSGSKEEDTNNPNNYPNGNLRIVNRRNWAAEPPTQTEPLATPVGKVFIVESSTLNCGTGPDCTLIVRHMQTDHKEGRSLWDIRYNFLVGGDGSVYEGRGWSVVGVTLPECNRNGIGICFIGAFTYDAPPKKQIKAAEKLIALGVSKGYIRPDYKVVYASQITGDGVNGVRSSDKLDEVIRSWPHWSNVDYIHNDTLKEDFCQSI